MVTLFVVLTVSAPLVAAAPEDRDQAKTLYREGRSLYSKKKFREAIRVLEQAYRHWKRREIHFNIVLCYFQLNDKIGVATHLRIYLKGATEKQRADVPKALMKMLGEVGILRIITDNPRAEVWIDGRLRGRGRLALVVEPGEWAAEIKLERRTVEYKIIRITAGKTVEWRVRAMGQRPVVVPPRGTPGRAGRKRLHWGYFVAAASVAALATGAAAGLGVKTQDLYREFERAPSASLSKQGRIYQNAANSMVGVAVAAATTAVVLALFTRWRSTGRESAVGIYPSAWPGGAAVNVVW